MPRFSAKLRRRKKELKELKKELDSFSPKGFPRGRPPNVDAKEIRGRAEKFRWIFDQVWDGLWPVLSKAQTEEDVERAFKDQAGTYYNRSEVWSSALVLRILRDQKFPKTRDAQVYFFSDSLAGLGDITPRYSRDICAKDRAREKRKHHIIRFEVYIVCSCGYAGHSRNQACPKCKTEVPFPWSSPFPI